MIIYVITDTYRKESGVYKVGIHSGSISALRSRYITSIPDLIIEDIFHVDSKELAKQMECDFKEKYKHLRLVNSNGNLSEWVTMQLADILAEFNVVQCIAKQCDGSIKLNMCNSNKEMAAERLEGEFETGISSFSIEEIWELFRLGKIRVPECQRPRDKDRVKIIQNYIKNNHSKNTFALGMLVFNVAEHIHVVDGQHRLEAISLLTKSEVEEHNLETFKIMADVRVGLSFEEERELFKNINQAVPCPHYILDETTSSAMLKSLGAFLQLHFAGYAKESRQCQRPHINISNILEALHTNGILRDLYESGDVSQYKDLEIGVLALNKYIGDNLKATGHSLYIKHADGASRAHSIEKFTSLMHQIAAKPLSIKGVRGAECYLGMVPVYKLVNFLFRHSTYA